MTTLRNLSSDPADLDGEDALLRATLRLNAQVFGGIFGVLAGILLCAYALIADALPGEDARVGVWLLAVFLPGYGTTWAGALAGLFWGVVLGSLLGGGVYWLNYRNAIARIPLITVDADGEFPVAVLGLHGPSLGIAIGAIGAAGLIVTTNWLVLRGTADESVHARLLSHFLPGYSVSFTGSLAGAAELFAVLFLICVVFAGLYNSIAAFRLRRR